MLLELEKTAKVIQEFTETAVVFTDVGQEVEGIKRLAGVIAKRILFTHDLREVVKNLG